MDIKFDCGWCGQSIAIDEAGAGQLVDCPKCRQSLTVPSRPSETKQCPFCAEEIRRDAVKCKHCGEFLDGRNRTTDSKLQSKPVKSQAEKEVWKGRPSYLSYFGYFIFGVLFLPVFGLGLLVIIAGLLDRNTRWYTLTNRRVVSKTGIIAREIHEVGTKDVRNINIKQNLLARLFGFGTVEIESAAAAGEGHVRFVGVKDPLAIRDLIRREKDEADSR